MKLIHSYLLALFLASASLHAMDQDAIRIVDYNPVTHGKKVSAIFLNAFPDAEEPPSELTKPTDHPETKIAVLEYLKKPAGFAIWNNETIPHKAAFSDIRRYKHSSAYLNILRLDYLAIANKFRKTNKRAGHGFGQRLLNHIGQVAQKTDQDIIALVAINRTRSFYEKHGYFKTTADATTHDSMALPMNEDMQDMLKQVKDDRTENKNKGIGLHFTKFLI